MSLQAYYSTLTFAKQYALFDAAQKQYAATAGSIAPVLTTSTIAFEGFIRWGAAQAGVVFAIRNNRAINSGFQEAYAILILADGKISCRYTRDDQTRVIHTTTSTLTMGVWAKIKVVATAGGTSQIFINDILDGTVNIPFQFQVSGTHPARLAWYHDFETNYFPGGIREVKIATDANFNNLAIYWPLNGSWNDESGNVYHLTPFRDPVFATL